METTKKCGRCTEIKPLEENFYICRTRKDGYRTTCKDCERIYIRAYYLRHPDRFRKAYKAFIERNPNYQKERIKNKLNKNECL